MRPRDNARARESVPAIATLLRRYSLQAPGMVFSSIDEEGAEIATLGYANLEREQPMTAHTLFPMASWTKSFYAIACRQLEELKLIPHFDAPIGDYIDLSRHGLPPEARAITFRDVLTHRSGVARDSLDKNCTTMQFNPSAHGTFNYANAPFRLIADAIHAITGKTFEEWVKNRIWKPLRMNDSYFMRDLGPHESRLVEGYYEPAAGVEIMERSHPLVREFHMPFSTPADTAKWASFLLYGNTSVLDDALRLECFEPHTARNQPDWGLGFQLSYPLPYITHAGHGASETGPRMEFTLDLMNKRGAMLFYPNKGAEVRRLTSGALTALEMAACNGYYSSGGDGPWVDLGKAGKNTRLTRVVSGSWTSKQAGGGIVIGRLGDGIVAFEQLDELLSGPLPYDDAGLTDGGSHVISPRIANSGIIGEERRFDGDGVQYQGAGGNNVLVRSESLWPEFGRMKITSIPIIARAGETTVAPEMPSLLDLTHS